MARGPPPGGPARLAVPWWNSRAALGCPPVEVGRSQDWALGVASQEVEVFYSELAKDVVLFSVTKGQ